MEAFLSDPLNILLPLIGGGWALWHFIHTTTKERVKQTTDLFTRYNSNDMLTSRDWAWYCLDQLNKLSTPVRFSAIWSAFDETERKLESETFDAIQQVGSFWFQLLTLHRRGLLDRKLTKELFGYQFFYWKIHFSRLVADTERLDQDRPEVIEPFRTSELDWLYEGREGLPRYEVPEPSKQLRASEGQPPAPLPSRVKGIEGKPGSQR